MLELNPADILKTRRVKSVSPHFSKIKISDSDRYDLNVSNWIKTKLKGRYYIASFPSLDETGKLKISTFAGFEENKELTYFMLACPYLRRNQ
jgi:hypothetical protein